MKHVGKVTILIFVCFLIILFMHVPVGIAQPMEEEEEEMMPKPNPMERTTKGQKVMMKELPSKGAAREVTSQAETGINSNGINSNGLRNAVTQGAADLKGETQGKVNTELGSGQAQQLNVLGQKETGKGLGTAAGPQVTTKTDQASGYVQKKLQDLEDNDMPNPMETGTRNNAASAYGWETGGNVPGVDPINPAGQVGYQPGTDGDDTGPVGPGQVGWDPTDINADIQDIGEKGTGYVGEDIGY